MNDKIIKLLEYAIDEADHDIYGAKPPHGSYYNITITLNWYLEAKEIIEKLKNDNTRNL